MRCPEKTAGVTARAGECDQADQKQGFLEKLLKQTSLIKLGRVYSSVYLSKHSVITRKQMIKKISKLEVSRLVARDPSGLLTIG